MVKPAGATANASTAVRVFRMRVLFMSMPPIRVAPTVVAWGSVSSSPSGTKVTSTAVQCGAEVLGHRA